MKAGPCWHGWEPACVRTSSRVAAQALSLLIMENDDILCFYSKQINEHQHTFTCILKWVWILLSWTRRQGTRANVCSWIFNYTFCDADKEALMSNICTHNNIQTKLFANTDLHLGKKKWRQFLNIWLASYSQYYFLVIAGKNMLSHWCSMV